MGQTKRVRWGLLAQGLLTVALLALVLSAVPWRDTVAALAKARLGPVAWALGAELLQRALFILRWHLLLRPIGVNQGYVTTLRLGFVALFYNNLTPSTLGGDAAKSYLLVRDRGADTPGVIASVLVDRFVIGWGSLVASGVIVSLLLPVPRFQTALVALAAAGVLGGLVAWWLARGALGVDDAPAQPLARVCRRVRVKLGEVASALFRYRRHAGVLVASLAASCLGILAMGLAMQRWCAAFDFALSFPHGVAIAVITKTVGMVPATVNGLGWTEGAVLVLLQWAGMPRPEALAVALVQRIAGIVISLVGAPAQFGRRAFPST